MLRNLFLVLSFSPVESATTARIMEMLGVRGLRSRFQERDKEGERDDGEIKSLKTSASGTAIARNQKGNQSGIKAQ